MENKSGLGAQLVPKILAQYTEASHALHALWTEAVGKPGYDKRAWQRLSNAIDRLGRDAATLAGYPKDKAMVGE